MKNLNTNTQESVETQ